MLLYLIFPILTTTKNSTAKAVLFFIHNNRRLAKREFYCLTLTGLVHTPSKSAISLTETVRPGWSGWTVQALPDQPEPESGCWSR